LVAVDGVISTTAQSIKSVRPP